MYPRGHIPDHDAVVRTRVGLHLFPEYGAMRSGTMPLRTTNRAKLPRSQGGPGIRNQFDVGGCEGCANSSGGTLQLAIDGTPLSEPISHVGTYLQSIMVTTAPNLDGTLPVLVDAGTMPSSILAGWGLFGGAAESVWGQLPMSQATMYLPDQSTPGSLIQPTPNQLFAARSCRLSGAYFLTTSNDALLRDIIRVLASGRVMTNAIPASGDDFQNYTGGILGALDGPIDHAQLIADYDWTGDQASLDAFMGGATLTSSGLLILHGVNSWGGIGCPDGGDWGEVDALNSLGGQYRANADYARQAQSWCVLDVRRTA